MQIIYQTIFNKIGRFAPEALAENMLITFKQDVPEELEDYCFIHCHGDLLAEVCVGDYMRFNDNTFEITAVGSVANFNLKELGHVTFRFDGAITAEYPGTIHLKGNVPAEIKVNDVLTIIKN
ncbi:PTS glucitol/sorbitol transporter subunit IIA [Avibacterium paragallinarum]|uniref:PTS glucitol/sorbitol transporter subunit IIA n=1 Tax=Avibacterium paragallinarum TaxID=728 RepID=UPI0021F6C773|nr:PTS glucitol/sorbitol transporter subunit IIA [Avibacterium paragallinarum]UXN34769.1 PTS glucitol/sorbitol transporter subunit IIA [Avibacterium paragallinarum]